MDFSQFLIEQLLNERNSKAAGESMGLTADPDKDPAKGNRFQYGNFLIQPPKDHHKRNSKERLDVYHKIVAFFKELDQAVAAISRKSLHDTFQKSRKPDGQLAVIRLICDADNEYAEMYQQDDPDKDGEWDAGDFLFNLDAKNNNIHTIVHALGHKHFYEVLPDADAEEWKDYYEVRKYKDKQEFVTKYAQDNHREDYAETFAVYVLGPELVNKLYDKPRINKDPEVVQKILKRFRQTIFKKSK